MTTKINQRAHRLRQLVSKVLGAFLVIAGTVLVTAPALSAADGGCGEYSYGFTGTRLINDGISTSAGPFAIDLPAGTYDIKMLSNDNHPSPDYQTEQTQEQWYFVLDNGYTSPPTDDVPNDRQDMVTNIGEVELAAATSITVKHLLQGGLNSVNVECVGFTPSAISVLPPETTTTEAPAIAAPATTETPIAAPATTTARAAVSPTTTADVAAVTTTIETQVQGVVETPVAQLAVTGRDTNLVVLMGVVLIMVGFALMSLSARPARQ